jgi:hypothetical protein
MASASPFQESHLWSTPIRDLGLTIAGTPLEPVLAQFQQELERVGIRRLKPDFHLSTEWGVSFDSISIGALHRVWRHLHHIASGFLVAFAIPIRAVRCEIHPQRASQRFASHRWLKVASPARPSSETLRIRIR